MTEEIVSHDTSRGNERTFFVIGQTPVTGVGVTWLPITQIITWGIFTRASAKRRPDGCRIAWSLEGFLKMVLVLGSEWLHNLAHLLVSNWIGKPMDRLNIQLGMPRCIYHQINDTEVTPRQHILRSLGGPLINFLLLQVGSLVKKLTREDSIAGAAANTFVQTNLFLSLVSLLPIPGIDGGPLLKWSLVEKGRSIKEADQILKEVNGPLAVGLGLFSSWSFLKKRTLLGLFTMMLGGISLAVFTGWLKEEEITF